MAGRKRSTAATQRQMAGGKETTAASRELVSGGAVRWPSMAGRKTTTAVSGCKPAAAAVAVNGLVSSVN